MKEMLLYPVRRDMGLGYDFPLSLKERSDDSSFSLFLVNNNETPSDAKYDFRGQPQHMIKEMCIM